jgi:hypothetical protein
LTSEQLVEILTLLVKSGMAETTQERFGFAQAAQGILNQAK